MTAAVTTPLPAARANLAEQVYATLKAQIHDFQLVAGDRFSEGPPRGDLRPLGGQCSGKAANVGAMFYLPLQCTILRSAIRNSTFSA